MFYNLVRVKFKIFLLALLISTGLYAQGANQISLGGGFKLINQDGKGVDNLSFNKDYLLIMFGFSSCPSICPIQLKIISEAFDYLQGRAEKIQPIFVSIDPARDTPEQLKAYHEMFHPNIEMLTGEEEQIKDMVKNYKIYVSKDQEVISHSSLVYLTDKYGRYITHFILSPSSSADFNKPERYMDPKLLAQKIIESTNAS